MSVRVLVVVLTVIGAVPIRICTCGAAHPCDNVPEPVREAPAGVTADPAQHEHDADCHAVKPFKKIFQSKSHARRRKQAIVAVARRLMVDLWRWKTGRATPEQLGWVMRTTPVAQPAKTKKTRKSAKAK